MEPQKKVQDIRALIIASETEEAIQRTRQLLSETQQEEGLVHLDMIESEWNDVQEQYINGLLTVDDQMRLQNGSKAKLMQLLLQIGGGKNIAANLVPKAFATASAPPRNESANKAFKDGLKNLIGVGLLLPTIGAVVEKNWGIALCFGIPGLVTFVPTLKWIEKMIRYELLSWQKYVIVIGLLLAAGALYVPK